MPKTVVIVEDDRALREELVQILGRSSDIQCRAAHASAEEALESIPKNPPDVVLMDIKLPKMSGIDCVRELKKALPNLQIIMLTEHQDSEVIFRALKSGASGYLLKSQSKGKLLDAIRDVQQGGSAFSSAVARKVVQHFQREDKLVQDKHGLTPREMEILNLLASGYIYKEIGDQLQIAPETVRTHVKNICAKMHVRSRLEAVAKHRPQPVSGGHPA